ncbi:unnamed protein product [Rotaria sp. Silwood2]|nr:unnamed protein product [Rotaria sp. Silwood2]
MHEFRNVTQPSQRLYEDLIAKQEISINEFKKELLNSSSKVLAETITSHSRSHHRHAHRDSSLPTHDQEKHLKFLSKVSQNDTLQRRNCDLQLNNHLRLYQQPLPSDEQHASPIRASSYNALQPVTVNIYSFFCET